MKKLSESGKTGYCNSCIRRVGVAKFRELSNGMCAECTKLYPAPVPVIQHQETATRTIPQSKNLVLSEDEQALIEVFNQLQSEGIGCHWRKAAGDRLGCNLERVKTLARRVQKKGAELVAISIEDKILEILGDEFQSAQEVWAHFPNFKYDWISIKLQNLANSKVLEVRKNHPYANLYRLGHLSKKGWCKTKEHTDGKPRFGLLTGGFCIECRNSSSSEEEQKLIQKLAEAEAQRDALNCEIKSLKYRLTRLKQHGENHETTDN